MIIRNALFHGKTPSTYLPQYSKFQMTQFKFFLEHIVKKDLGVLGMMYRFQFFEKITPKTNQISLVISQDDVSVLNTSSDIADAINPNALVMYQMILDDVSIRNFVAHGLANQNLSKYMAYSTFMFDAATLNADKLAEFKVVFEKTNYFQSSTDAEKQQIWNDLDLFTQIKGHFFNIVKIDYVYKTLVNWVADQTSTKPMYSWNPAIYSFSQIENLTEFQKFFTIDKEIFFFHLADVDQFLDTTDFFQNLKTQGIDFIAPTSYLSNLKKLQKAIGLGLMPNPIVMKRKFS